MSNRQPPDSAARKAAIDPSRSFIVQAPAGSGKTSLLTDRILALLALVDEPEQIVAMTFTRKAAAEMHARVMEKLQRATSSEPPEQDHERDGWQLARAALARDSQQGWGLLHHPARLRIQTIDSFCASLVRAMPWLTGLGGMPRIVDDAPALYTEAARRTVEAADQQSCVQRLLKHLDLKVADVAQAITDMLGKRDHWLPLLSHGEDGDLLQVFLEQTIADELECLAQSMPIGWQQTLAEPARRAAQALIDDGQPDHPIVALLDWQAGHLLPDPSDLPLWRGLHALLLTTKGELRQKIDKRTGFPSGSPQKIALTDWLESVAVGNESPLWVRGLQAVAGMPDPALTQQQRDILEAQLASLRLAAANLMLVFAERGEVDFIEVAQRAVQALGHADDPSDLLLKLDNRIAHLLVDEFQDTSQTQLDLLTRLTAGWQPADGRTLFLVGDPMQSIYRFRKAEVSLFLRVQDKGIGDIELECLTLTANFRSQAGVVNWVNQTFGPLFPAVNHPEFGAIRYEKAHPWHEESVGQAVTWHIELDDQAAWERVVGIARDAWQTHAESDKPMAILVRSRPHLGDVTRALTKAGLPCRAVELDSLQSRAVVVDLLQLARALSHRGDRAAWLSVLRAPWCGLTAGTMLKLFVDERQAIGDVLAKCLALSAAPEGIDSDQWTRLLGVAQVLLAALADDDARPFVARLEETWRSLQGDRLVSAQSDLLDAQSFFGLVQRSSDYSHVDLDELERQLAKLYAQPQSAGRAIEVMTMHKAKGLEFEVVVLLGLERQAKSDTPPLVRVEQHEDRVLFGPIKARIAEEQDALSKYLAQREKMRQHYETDRLLYVAATRAREFLHLVAVGKVNDKTGHWADPNKTSLLWRLWPFRPQMPVPTEDASASDATESKPIWQAPALLRIRDPITAGNTQKQQLQARTRSDRYSWPSTETIERISGILIHAWLARFALQSGPIEVRTVPSQEALMRQLRALGLPAALRPEAAAEVAAALDAMLKSQRGQWLLSQPLRQVEWALIDARQTVSIMDLAIDTPDGWLVVDYKTSRPAAGEDLQVFASRMTERYRAQMTRYRQQLQLLDGRAATSVLYFPREDLWLEVQ
ncbi:MAG: UvrD-helicase domain-containing protein [Burkholderiaceae bacterium]|nr:UvrD-helicase domain-containing protein [Burkholderiaceae bacterium]